MKAGGVGSSRKSPKPLPTGAATESTLAGRASEAKLEAVRALVDLLLTQATFQALVGEVAAAPTANTLLGRLKEIHDELVSLAAVSETQPVSDQAVQDLIGATVSPAAGTVNKRLSDIVGKVATDTTLGTRLAETTFTGRLGEVQAAPAANTLLGRLKALEDAHTALLTELKLKADLTETQPVSQASQPLPTGASTETTLAKLLEGGNYEVFNLALDVAKADEAVFGTTETIRWVMLRYYDGANADPTAPDQVLKVGSSADDGIPLWLLTRPDTEVLWTGRRSGDLYVTTTAQAGKRLILVVGYE